MVFFIQWQMTNIARFWCFLGSWHEQAVEKTIDLPMIMRAITLLQRDCKNCRLRMCRECRERFPRHRLQRKPLVSDPGMHHGRCVTHVPWCMSGSLTHGGGEIVPGIPGACATRYFMYLVKGPYSKHRCRNRALIGFDMPLHILMLYQNDSSNSDETGVIFLYLFLFCKRPFTLSVHGLVP